MVSKKVYINSKKRIMDFGIGSTTLAMIQCENKRESCKASNLAKVMLKYNNININRISKVLESIKDGIYVEQEKGPDKQFPITRYNEDFKSYSIDYHELFNLFLETLVVYPVADRSIEKETFFKDIKKEEYKFTKFIKKFADNFNFEEQDWALFELGETLSYACALYLKTNVVHMSPWHKLGDFIRNPENSPSTSESVKELM